MRKSLLTLLALPLLTPPALAWSPSLDEATAQQVIDTAFQRPATDARPTFQTVNLAVENGTFKVPGAVTQFSGPDTCLSSWQTEPGNFAGGSRIQSVTASGQADSVYWQATKAYKDWKNLKAADVLTEEARAGRMADNLLRIDVKVSGAASEQTRRAYRVRLQAGETFVNPVRQSYVADWKQDSAGLWSGTVVYYFDASPAEGQSGLRFDPAGQVNLQFMNERSECGYSVPLNLGSFI
ncbi:hypothetical protein Deipr_0577 [Deinococcus proteolyticus MRP]|uniref:Uncharacterized protein n=1 Tax=Deinococcus proteolyticus (strain ATCC 35074 / DSM 20540 / JCM 6276 / NBRC 101906 / NCIMB 13154 / VKM Ac-1939 / CCM 2703 / MRP) TaxID=693977 RepID=F0RKW6_DEIPM|nr:hypothetical protein [Deinococcus proteolyticus]ADY25739.1 hypothetical protein Deipr_0577 [Deinococcus proteolyticus MRP]